MALTPPVVLTALQQSRGTGIFPLAGQSYDRFAAALADGLCKWAVGQPQNLALSGSISGVAGVGAVNPAMTRMVVQPSTPLVTLALIGAGMAGPAASSLAQAVSVGVASAFSSAGQFTGPVVGVSNGISVAKVTTANAASLFAILGTSFGAMFGAGSASTILTQGLANGISAILLLGSGTGQVLGVPVVPPVPAVTLALHTVV